MNFKLLTRLTFALLRRRAGLYAALAVAALGLEALVASAVRPPRGEFVADLLALPAVTTVTYATIAADLLGRYDARAVWSRILERLWAVLVIDVAISLCAAFAFALANGSLSDLFAATLVQLFLALTVFVDVIAVLVDEDPWYALVPLSFVRGLRFALHGNLRRCFVVYALGLCVTLLQMGANAFVTRFASAAAAFWTVHALGTICALAVSAFTVLVYFDAAGIVTTALAADDTVQ